MNRYSRGLARTTAAALAAGAIVATGFAAPASAAADKLTLGPATGLAATNGSQCVTAKATLLGFSQSNQTVKFQIVAGPNKGKALADAVTNSSGEATRCYSSSVSGVDTLQATVAGLTGTTTSNTVTRTWNAAPVVSILSPANLSGHELGLATKVVANVSDADGDLRSCEISFDDGGAALVGTIANGQCTVSKTLAKVGVYTIKVTAKDALNQATTASTILGVWDQRGSLSGTAKYDSQAGAVTAQPAVTGEATLALSAYYGSSLSSAPSGSVRLQLASANLDFQSSSISWFVPLSGKAELRGVGTLNGVAGYSFLVQVKDGGLFGKDAVDIRIWKTVDGSVVYDTVKNTNDDLDAAAPQTVKSGSYSISA
ncbi:MAG TPA: hypothetical protein VLI04_15220 [Nocardioidaceae bacterium]|nr:hypothetical protein [Nocardioidaceae bacterium]